MVLDVNVVYPRWSQAAAADAALVNAWTDFQDQIERQWARQRDEYLVRAAEVVRRSRRYEDHCPLLLQRFHNVVVDVMDESRPLEGRPTPEPVGLAWPPSGHEELLVAEAVVAPSSETPPPAVASAGSVDVDPTWGSGPPPSVAVRPGLPRPSATPAPDLEYAIQTDLRGSVPTGFVVGLHHQGKLDYLNAFGTHPETGDALTIDTPVPLAPFTEVLVSTLTVALHAANLLDIDAPISSYLADLSPRLGRVTTRQLLEHRAGLDNAPPLDSTMAWDRVLDRLNDRALFTDPGVLPSYSSYSFGLAARVIERAIGITLEDALQTMLLDPLGMDSTSLGGREDVVAGLRVTHTSAADLLRFWYAWLDGSIAGAGIDRGPEPPIRTLAPDGRTFAGGLWIDRPGGAPRLSMVCGSAGAHVVVQVLPTTSTVVIVIGLGAWPLHTGIFMLDAVGRSLLIDDEIFGPVHLAGVAGFGTRPRPCFQIRTSQPYVPWDFGPRAEAADWEGRYVNGDWFFALDEEEGLLVSPRAEGGLWQIHHFEGDTHFASVPPWEGRGVGFPFRLFRGPDGRRYVMLGDRAYLHEEDRPGG